MKFLKVFFVMITFVACKKEQELVTPVCLLSETEMVNVMVDLSLVKSSKSLGRQGLKDSGIKPLEYMFAKHGVDTVVVRENLEYYNADLKKAKELYSKIVDSLQRRKEVLETYIDSLPSTIKEKENELLEEDEETIDSLSNPKKEGKKPKLLKKDVDLPPKKVKKENKKNKILEKVIDSLPVSEDKNQKKEDVLLKEIVDWQQEFKEQKKKGVLSEKETNSLFNLNDKNQEVVKED